MLRGAFVLASSVSLFYHHLGIYITYFFFFPEPSVYPRHVFLFSGFNRSGTTSFDMSRMLPIFYDTYQCHHHENIFSLPFPSEHSTDVSVLWSLPHIYR